MRSLGIPRLQPWGGCQAIDPEIKAQLIATSLGEYAKAKVKLPLAGRQVDS